MFTNARLKAALRIVEYEVFSAVNIHPPLHSLHEAYGVIKEEFDELWEEIRKKRQERSDEKLLVEASHVAAMAIRLMLDCISDERLA